MFNILNCFLVAGLVLSGFGDDVIIGISVLKDVVLNDGELMLESDVDGIDASDILSIINGLVDIFCIECLLSSPFGIKYIFVEELFGCSKMGKSMCLHFCLGCCILMLPYQCSLYVSTYRSRHKLWILFYMLFGISCKGILVVLVLGLSLCHSVRVR